EQAATLRMIPRMSVWRPCDTVESAVAWQHAIERADGPTSLLFARQNLAYQSRDAEQVAAIRRGGYTIRDCQGEPEAVIIATGSEVALAIDAAARLGQSGRRVRVVSMPSTDVFDGQDESWKESVLPSSVRARLAIEAGVSDYWRKYVGLDGRVIGVDTFGESAPAEEVFRQFGFTVDNVVENVEALLG
ncbi:MAG: transketolase, partial [Proteobacteria bacterium]